MLLRVLALREKANPAFPVILSVPALCVGEHILVPEVLSMFADPEITLWWPWARSLAGYAAPERRERRRCDGEFVHSR